MLPIALLQIKLDKQHGLKVPLHDTTEASSPEFLVQDSLEFVTCLTHVYDKDHHK